MSYVVLSQSWGGLGDNLQLSTLPELFTDKGIDVYLSTHNVYRNNNTDIKRMVWDENPFIKGTIDEPGSIGQNYYHKIQEGKAGSNIIKKWEIAHGFNIGDNYKQPKIYYKPKVISDVANKVIADFTAISTYGKYNLQKIKRYISENYTKDELFIIKNKNGLFSNSHVETSNIIEYNDIFEYSDLISSSRKFICMYSGSSVLAAAVNTGKTNTIDCILPSTREFSITAQEPWYYFTNINYIETYD